MCFVQTSLTSLCWFAQNLLLDVQMMRPNIDDVVTKGRTNENEIQTMIEHSEVQTQPKDFSLISLLYKNMLAFLFISYSLILVVTFFFGRYEMIKQLFIGTKVYFLRSTSENSFIANVNDWLTLEVVLFGIGLFLVLQGYYIYGYMKALVYRVVTGPIMTSLIVVLSNVPISLYQSFSLILATSYNAYVFAYNDTLVKLQVKK